MEVSSGIRLAYAKLDPAIRAEYSLEEYAILPDDEKHRLTAGDYAPSLDYEEDVL